jgi:hypothetical protein
MRNLSSLSGFGVAVGCTLICSSLVAADAPQLILECRGFNAQKDDTIAHYVVISGNTATVDGEPYNVTSSPIELVFAGASTANKGAPKALNINRISGAYAFSVQGQPAGQSQDWSRPEDPGCKKVEQKF